MGICLLALVGIPSISVAKDDAPQMKRITFTDESTSTKFNVVGTVIGDYFQTNTPLVILTQSGDTVISGTYIGNENYTYINGCLHLSDRNGNRARVIGSFILNTGLSADDGKVLSKREKALKNSDNPLDQAIFQASQSLHGSKNQNISSHSKLLSVKKKKWACLLFIPMGEQNVKIPFLEYYNQESKKTIRYSCRNDTLVVKYDNKAAPDVRNIYSISPMNRFIVQSSNTPEMSGRFDFSSISLKTASNCWLEIFFPTILHDACITYKDDTKVFCSELMCDYGKPHISDSFQASTSSGQLIIKWPSPSKDILSVWAELTFGQHSKNNISQGWLSQCPSLSALGNVADGYEDSKIKWFCKKNDGKTYSLSGTNWMDLKNLPSSDIKHTIWQHTLSGGQNWYTVYSEISKLKNSYEEELAIQKKNEKEKEKMIEEARKKKYNELVAKYGEKYANAMIDRKVVIGMSKSMVEECISPLMYNITENVNSQIWILNEEKAEMVLLADARKNNQENELAQIMFTAGLLGKSVGEVIGSFAPKRIVFFGNKVSSVTY